jgi:hypothetical protein
MASEKIKNILSPDGMKQAQGELSFFFRKILWNIGMTTHLWEFKLQRFLERHERTIPKNAKDRSYAKGNLNTQFTNPQMTWRTFMEALMFLGPKKIRLDLHLEWPRGDTTVHTMNIRTRQMSDDMFSVAEEDIAVSTPSKSAFVDQDDPGAANTAGHVAPSRDPSDVPDVDESL